ncbi:MAG: hypothetical protein IPQ19_05055 [Bacteroidetes bacterium]|nr:hypothetical protein [Bacteroidota bacterium]
MNNQKQIRNILLLVVIGFTSILASCKKDKLTDNETQQIKINEIIPQNYLDTIKSLGIIIHEGTTPPIVNGIYEVNPSILIASNVNGDIIGSTFSDVKVKLENQNNSNFDIKLLGKQFLSTNDTSINTAISGSGNNFTIYGKVKSTSGSASAIFGIILSGTIGADGIMAYQNALINIDNSNGVGSYIPEGTGRVIRDGNNLASKITVF